MVHFITRTESSFCTLITPNKCRESVLDHESRVSLFYQFSVLLLDLRPLLPLSLASRLAGVLALEKRSRAKKIFHISAKDSRFSSNIPLLVGANETLLIALLVLNTRQLEIY
jgi:hypothetical protein